ncbi:MAG: hypothetical protein ACOYOH_11470 [Paracraurococcus sp.]
MNAKMQSIATALFDLDGAWEVTFQFTSGEQDIDVDDFSNVPRQAFLTIWRHRLLGQDALGVVWRGQLRWMADQRIEAVITFDPLDAVPNAGVLNANGDLLRSPSEHVIMLDVVSPGEPMRLHGVLRVGQSQADGHLKRLRTFDGAVG